MNRADRRAARRPGARPSVELHIGELSLTGFPPLRHREITESVRAELTRLIAAGGLPAELAVPGNFGRVRGAAIPNAGGPAAAVGRQIAGAIIGGRRP